jgi:hypothetical protein
MYDNENTYWINNQLFHYRDTMYNTNSNLDLNLTSNSKDLKNYSIPSMGIVISSSNTGRRFQNLSIQNVYDLNESLSYVSKNFDKIYEENSYEMAKRYSNDRDLIIAFRKSTVTGEKCVVIRIQHNENDYGRIIIPYSIFNCVIGILDQYQKDYLKLCTDMQNRFLLSEILDSYKTTERSIKSIPAAISAIQINNSNHTPISPFDLQDEVSEEMDNEGFDPQLEDLDKFIEASNITIPEIDKISKEQIEETPKSTQTLTSNLFEKVLKNDISKFEDLINSTYLLPSPIETIIETLNETLNPNSDFNFLPGISEKEKKSTLYFSKCLFSTIFQSHIHGSSIPLSVPVIKYRVDFDKVQDLNNELSYDFFLISTYLKIFRNKISDKEENTSINKSLIYMGARCFTDILAYSFLENKDVSSLKTVIAARFYYFNSTGFFESYNKILESYGCSKINANEINTLIDETGNRIIRKSEFIDETHQFMYEKGQLKLPSDNNFTCEQIKNDIVRFEVGMKFGEINVETLDMDKDIKSMLLNKPKPPVTVAARKHDTPLFRLLKTYIEEIPLTYREKFMDNISKLEGDYDLGNPDYPAEELGENVLKTLYEWNESGKKDPFSNFCIKVEESIMTKDLIIAKIRSSKDAKIDSEIEQESDDAWDMIL